VSSANYHIDDLARDLAHLSVSATERAALDHYTRRSTAQWMNIINDQRRGINQVIRGATPDLADVERRINGLAATVLGAQVAIYHKRHNLTPAPAADVEQDRFSE